MESLHKAEIPRNLKVTLIGEIGDSETQKQIQAAIHKYELHQQIEQLPATTDIAQHYHNTNITVLPSTTESFPNVILESFAARKPIIVSDAANNSNIVQHNINGWVFPTGDSDALAQYLNIASRTTPDEQKIMGERGHMTAEGYSIERMVERYTWLYKRALKES